MLSKSKLEKEKDFLKLKELRKKIKETSDYDLHDKLCCRCVDLIKSLLNKGYLLFDLATCY